MGGVACQRTFGQAILGTLQPCVSRFRRILCPHHGSVDGPVLITYRASERQEQQLCRCNWPLGREEDDFRHHAVLRSQHRLLRHGFDALGRRRPVVHNVAQYRQRPNCPRWPHDALPKENEGEDHIYLACSVRLIVCIDIRSSLYTLGPYNLRPTP
jgi:hypothetical protein